MYTAVPVVPSSRFSHVTVSVIESSVSIPLDIATPVDDDAATLTGRAMPSSVHSE